jgi:hypothetical protein
MAQNVCSICSSPAIRAAVDRLLRDGCTHQEVVERIETTGKKKLSKSGVGRHALHADMVTDVTGSAESDQTLKRLLRTANKILGKAMRTRNHSAALRAFDSVCDLEKRRAQASAVPAGTACPRCGRKEIATIRLITEEPTVEEAAIELHDRQVLATYLTRLVEQKSASPALAAAKAEFQRRDAR